MKMSTRGRYGLRIMLDLAVNYLDKPVLLRDISNRQGISEKYLWQLIAPLKNAGLIQSIRGVHGGYKLKNDANQITLKDIIVTLEGPLTVTDCVNDSIVCDKSYNCITREVWQELSLKMVETLESITLDDILKKYKKNSGLRCSHYDKPLPS